MIIENEISANRKIDKTNKKISDISVLKEIKELFDKVEKNIPKQIDYREDEYIRLLKYSTKYTKLILHLYNNYIFTIDSLLHSRYKFRTLTFYIVEILYKYFTKCFEDIVWFNKFNSISLPNKDIENINNKGKNSNNFNYSDVYINVIFRIFHKYINHIKGEILSNIKKYFDEKFSKFSLNDTTLKTENGIKNENKYLDYVYYKLTINFVEKTFFKILKNFLKEKTFEFIPEHNGDFFNHTQIIFVLIKEFLEFSTLFIASIDRSINVKNVIELSNVYTNDSDNIHLGNKKKYKLTLDYFKIYIPLSFLELDTSKNLSYLQKILLEFFENIYSNNNNLDVDLEFKRLQFKLVHKTNIIDDNELSVIFTERFKLFEYEFCNIFKSKFNRDIIIELVN